MRVEQEPAPRGSGVPPRCGAAVTSDPLFFPTRDAHSFLLSPTQGQRSNLSGVLTEGYRPWHWVPASCRDDRDRGSLLVSSSIASPWCRIGCARFCPKRLSWVASTALSAPTGPERPVCWRQSGCSAPPPTAAWTTRRSSGAVFVPACLTCIEARSKDNSRVRKSGSGRST
jgi:hypothetical protein